MAPQPLGMAPAGASPCWGIWHPAAEPEHVVLSLAWCGGTRGPTQVPWLGEQRPLRPGWQHALERGKGQGHPGPSPVIKELCSPYPTAKPWGLPNVLAPRPQHSPVGAWQHLQRSLDTVNTSNSTPLPSSCSLCDGKEIWHLQLPAHNSQFLPQVSLCSPELDRQSISERRAGRSNHNNSDSSWQAKKVCCSL